MQTKIAFFDIDGTLIDMQSKRITEKTLEALQRLRAGGVKICLATGRSPVALPVFPGVEFDAYLTFNGSLCYTAGGETIFSNPIAHEDVQKIIANGAAIGRPVCVSVRDRLAANGTDVDLTDYFAIAKMVVPITDEFDTVCREDVYQLMMGGRKDEYDAILRGVDGSKIAAWWDARWISSRPAAARVQASGRFWNITVLTRPRQWRSATATTILRCCKPWATPLPWGMRRRS